MSSDDRPRQGLRKALDAIPRNTAFPKRVPFYAHHVSHIPGDVIGFRSDSNYS